MTEAIYLEVENKSGDLQGKRRVFISGILRILGVSRLENNAWLYRLSSNQDKRKQSVKLKIKDII
jgi:hypothetical protein